MLGDPVGVDPLTVVIDRFTAAASTRLAHGARRARSWLREQDPAARLGMEIIAGAQRQMVESRAQEALATIPAVARGRWWLAPGLACGGVDGRVHVIATDRRIVTIEAHEHWNGECAGATMIPALVDRLGGDRLEVVPVVATTNGPVQPRWGSTGDCEDVLFTSLERLAVVVEHQLHGSGAYDPERNHPLSRLLYGAQVGERQRSLALSVFGRGLDLRRWVIAPGTQPPAVDAPIDLLAIGPTGIFVCEAAGIEPLRVARHATAAAHAVALRGGGLDAEVIPVILCEPGGRAHQLELQNGNRVWALPLDEAPAHLRAAGRRGLRSSRVRRLRRPAPGWRYGMQDTESGLTYEVRYDRSRHDRPRTRR